MNGKIGVLAPGGHGDIFSAMSVLKYKDILWPGKEMCWFCSPPQSECLKYAPVEVRPWEDFSQLIINKGKNNGLNEDLKKHFASLADIETCYFPLPWMYEPHEAPRAGKPYPNVSKGIFGVPTDWEWHPKLYFLTEEEQMVKDFCLNLPYKKTIMLETGSRSFQSAWNDNMTQNTISLCRKYFGQCNFIFASKQDNVENYQDKDYSNFFDQPGMVSCSHFTIRQAALVNNYSDLFIGISSGLSVATSCWGNKPTPKLQYCNSHICSTVALANGPIELIEIHGNPNPEQTYYNRLEGMLQKF